MSEAGDSMPQVGEFTVRGGRFNAAGGEFTVSGGRFNAAGGEFTVAGGLKSRSMLKANRSTSEAR
eukprot:5322455-Pyramimonas_sp.AAC.1